MSTYFLRNYNHSQKCYELCGEFRLFYKSTYVSNEAGIVAKRLIMDSKRQQKVARQIQKDLSEIFQKDLKGQLDGAFVTITEVRVTPDLSIARVHLSVMLAKNNAWLLEAIREKAKHIRNLLGQRIRHQMRIVPDLQFFLDDSAEYAAKMDALISSLNIPPLKEGEQPLED